MKYKIGDKVRVRKDLKAGNEYQIHVSEEMAKYKGQIMTIKCIKDSYYVLKEAKREDSHLLEWHWTDDMLVDINFTSDDLQFGDILTLRNGERYVYASGYIHGEEYRYHCNGESLELFFKKDLSRESGCNEYDIMKVEREGQVVYEREDVRKMTVEEISEALGYEVKVVK